MSDAQRDLDIVVFGATGFVGRLVAEHLAAYAPDGVRIGLAGRDADKLAAVRDGLGAGAQEWPLVVADAGDRASVDALARSARVVVTTVGPYLRYGMPLVEACAEAGTDYVDLTGEVLFVQQTLAHCADAARASGARIVHSCGFDSVPSDLGVLLLAEAARADGAGELEDTAMVVRSMKGGFSGGTIDSARAMAEAVAADRSLLGAMTDPYALSPDRDAEPDAGRSPDAAPIRRDGSVGAWVGPFVMAPYNTRVVRLSNALQGHAYGRGFRYREAMAYGDDLAAPLRAAAVSAGVVVGLAGFAFAPTRAVLDRLLPAPGEGPDEESRRTGSFETETRARTTSGASYRCVIAAQGDPGYAATAVMMGESALALVLDRDRLPGLTGVLTPASGIGAVLADRLRAAGFRIDVGRLDP
ncbi:MAG: saccharopine dehydrogenase NADP-binding domain-containing protein [Candidatus Nanopelagicales bacterium]